MESIPILSVRKPDGTVVDLPALVGRTGATIQQVERTVGTGKAGEVDTWTITMTDGATHDFYVTNGMDGDGGTEWAYMAKSYAVGGTGTREGEDADNAAYYAQQAKNTLSGCVSKAGDEMTGDLTIHKDRPTLVQQVPESTAFAKVVKNANGANDFGVDLLDAVDESNYTKLTLGHKDGALKVTRTENGQPVSVYNLYHEGSKPDGLSSGDNRLRLNSAGAAKEAVQTDIAGSTYNLFGQHNKPRGQYVGNGNAEERLIETGGLGNVCIVTSNNGIMALVTGSGMFYGSGTTNPTIKDSGVAMFEAGVLKLNTGVYINAADVIFTYQVL